MELAQAAPAVVCCRCSPTQKVSRIPSPPLPPLRQKRLIIRQAEIVKQLILKTGKRTCAIGDGGNDVSMIQAANVGIGIVGKEGNQASLAADFSITQFSHLTRLIRIIILLLSYLVLNRFSVWHGRNSCACHPQVVREVLAY